MEKYVFDELNEAELEGVVGGSGNIDWEAFRTSLIKSGAQDVPALSELVDYTADGNWKKVASMLPKFLTNPMVLNAFNAANND